MGSSQSNEANKKQLLQQVQTINRIYQRKQLIGKGTYGKVYRCINKLNGQEYALKVVDITAKNKEQAIKQINNLKSQIGLLKKINHKNIVRYYSFDISEDNKQVQIVLEYAKNGSLKEYVEQRGGLSEKETIQKVKQILCGLKYLHNENIVHRDLKCTNILIMDDSTLKITDFGTAKSMKTSSSDDIANNCLSIKGTPYYMAPQVLKRTGHNTPADIWSLGCLIIQMFTGKTPWTGLTTSFQEIINYIMCGIHPPYPKNISNQFFCFLQSCLDNIPSQRLTAQQLQKHRWIDKNSSVSRLQTKQNSKVTVDYIIKEDLFETMQFEDKKNKRILKQQKYKQINTYMNDKNKLNEQKNIKSHQRSAKSKRNNKSIGNYYEQMNNVIEEIQITPYVEIQNQINKVQNNKNVRFHQGDKKNVKTTPHIKFSDNNAEDIKEISEDLENSLVVIKLPPKNQNVDGRVKIQINQQQPLGVIDTMISRQQKNRYLQQQKILRQQRQQQKLKWQRELREGANYLRQEINNRYIL